MRSRRDQAGSAIADFVLTSVVLVPLFFGMLQLALIWHVESTLTSAASDGASYGATFRHTPQQGAGQTRRLVAQTFGGGLAASVRGVASPVDGQPGVRVEVTAHVPMLFIWGPTVTVHVSGHAIRERLP